MKQVLMGAIGVVLGMLGMFCIHSMSEDFVAHSFAKVGDLGELRGYMGAVCQHEKDMIIHYERSENVQKAHVQWLASLEMATKSVERFLQRGGAGDETRARAILQRLQAYRDQFAHVARQLEEGAMTRRRLPTA